MRGFVARPGFDQRTRHQAAIAPQRMRAPEALGVTMRGIGLIRQTVDQKGRLGGGRKQSCGLDEIARQAAAHG